MQRPKCATWRRGTSRAAAAPARSARSSSGCCASAANWIASSRNSRVEDRKRGAFRGRLRYRALLIVGGAARLLSLPRARVIGRAMGRMAWYMDRRERNKALRNIGIAFPDWTDARRRKTIKAMFLHLGESLGEILWMPNLDLPARDRMNIVTGMDGILRVIDEGRGVITFTAHCGNWEWLCYSMGMYGRPVSVLQRERDEVEMN